MTEREIRDDVGQEILHALVDAWDAEYFRLGVRDVFLRGSGTDKGYRKLHRLMSAYRALDGEVTP